jgi:uncharacterized protein DUF3592
MDSFEKNYERTVDKAVNAAEKVGNAANRAYIGCITIFANLFFAAFCLWGAYAAYTGWQLQTNGESTTGVVIRMEESSSGESGCCVYSPVVEFNANGQTYSFEGDNASDPPAYRVGEEVPVLYDPARPETAQINKWTERWLFPIIIIPAMILAALLVNFFMIRAWRRGESILE